MTDKLPFGRTGHMSTRTLFGGWALAEVTQAEADRALDVLLEYGVNHIDTAASYGDSELRIGPWMDRHRKDFFLATKTEERTYQAAKEEFHRSLERLRVDQVDLLQLHYLVDPQEWETALGPGGALEAAIEARDQGLVRFIGVTGHDVAVARMHIRSLERFDFDSVLLPYNYLMMQNPDYAKDFETLTKMCQERNIAVQTIKSIVKQPNWGSEPQRYHMWYKPLEDEAAIEKSVHWVLGRPGVFLNTPGDVYFLPKVLEAANRFDGSRPSDEDMEKLVASKDMAPIFS